jgi:hypothetical protein
VLDPFQRSNEREISTKHGKKVFKKRKGEEIKENSKCLDDLTATIEKHTYGKRGKCGNAS